MNKRHFSLAAIALLSLCLIAFIGCSGNQTSSDRSGSNNVFITDLIAGAGQGWPATGTDIGYVKVEQVGSDLVVTFNAEGGSTLDVCHLYVGVDGPDTTAPGQFPFSGDALGTSTYVFTLPMAGNYPPVGNDPGGPYNWAGEQLYIAAHAEANVYISGGGGGGGGTDPVVCQGPISQMGIHAGNSNQGNGVLVGNVYISVVGTNLVVTGTTIAPHTFTETHLYVGLTPPTQHSPGQFPYKHSPLPSGTTTDTYTIPLDQILNQQIGGTPVGADCGDLLYIAWHSTTLPGGQSSSAWNPDCRVRIPGHNWKSYCSFSLPCCPPDPDPDPEVFAEETAWGFDSPGDPDPDTSKDEDGWFENFFNDPRLKWGWVFTYTAQ